MDVESVNDGINLGDLIITLVSFGFLAIIVILVIWFLASNKKRKNQLNDIENKIDALSEKINKDND